MNKEIQEDLNALSLRMPFNLPARFFQHEEENNRYLKHFPSWKTSLEPQRTFEIKGYTFFISNFYQRNKDKESECIPVANINNSVDKDNKITFQVKDPVPIDYLDKMRDKERDLKLLGETVADDFLKNYENTDWNSTPRFLKSSKPYIRKNNVTSDLSHIETWKTWFRFNGFDLYITILRRQYIPPIGDCFQDIIICSKYKFPSVKSSSQVPDANLDLEEMKINRGSSMHLVDIHRRIIDSIHTRNIG